MRSQHQSALAPVPALSTGEWRAVQNALRAVHGSSCNGGEHPGPLQRGLARIGRIMPVLRPRPTHAVAPEHEPLRDFLCESARHGPAVDDLAQALKRQGYSQAQIAALTLIAG